MTPSIRARFIHRAEPGRTAFASEDSEPWRCNGGRQLLHDDERLHCEVNFPFDNALLAVSGPRVLIVAGSLRGFGGHSADAAARLGALIARDPGAALQQLRGPFILLYVDGGRDTLLFATDRAATRSPCYAIDPDGSISIGLTAGDVAAVRDRPRALRPQALFDYVHSHVIPAPETIFADVERLLPGQCLHVEGGHPKVETWWTPRYSAAYTQSDLPVAAHEFRDFLRDAVAAQLDGGPTGAFLSGGTDSSTIAGMLGIASGAAANTYSIGFDVDGFDEIGYARIAATHFKTRHHEYYLTPDDLLASIPAVAASYDQPFGNSSVIAAYYCARLAAADGMKKLLGGDGGDELFGGNTRYARQKVFEAYSAAPGWLARGLAEPLLRVAATKHLPLLRKARSYVEQAIVPMPARMHTYNLVDHIGRERIFEPGFLDAIDPGAPARQHAAFYARCEDSSVINRMLHYDWKFTLSDNDLPKVVGACDLAGIAVGFPFLDERIVDFANGLPADWKVRRLRLRYFFKTALAEFLPHEIIAKKKHGFGLPFGHWLTGHAGLRGLATGSLESLRDRGVVRAPFFDELLRRVATEHATFYGELVWILMMLEQWLGAHAPEYRFSG